MKLTTAPRGSRQTVLVFGPPKTGKTQLVSQLALTHNLIWFDLENGHATLFKLPPEAQARVELIALKDTKSFPIAIETCNKVIKGGKFSICEAHGKVSCALCKKDSLPFTELDLTDNLPDNTIVVFDSLTQLTSSAIANITKDKPEDYKMQTDDWGNLSKLMDVFLSHVQQPKFNIVCISHETETELEDGKVRIVPTMGSRNFSRSMAKAFGHVVYCEVKNLKHKFTSSSTAMVNVITGSRTDVALEKMNEPSLASIFRINDDRSSGMSSNISGASAVSITENDSRGEVSNIEAHKTNGELAASRLTGLAAVLAAKKAADGK